MLELKQEPAWTGSLGMGPEIDFVRKVHSYLALLSPFSPRPEKKLLSVGRIAAEYCKEKRSPPLLHQSLAGSVQHGGI